MTDDARGKKPVPMARQDAVATEPSASGGGGPGIVIDPRAAVVGGAAAVVGVAVLGVFLWMIPGAASREADAACRGLKAEAALNGALCPGGAPCALPAPAPDFTATDITGKQVKLSDFRGKVVLLNFWASWCGVCKHEKPALNAMASEMASDDFVVVALASDHAWPDALTAVVDSLAPQAALVDLNNASAPALAALPGVGHEGAAKIIAGRPYASAEAVTAGSVLPSGVGKAIADRVYANASNKPTLENVRGAFARGLPGGTPFKVLLDPPQGDENIGQITASWGIKAVPESALIDRKGNIRAYFVNKRDWSSTVAQTCLRSVIDGE